MRPVIFDFDGVIIDTERVRFKGLQDIVKKETGTVLSDDYFLPCVGRKTNAFLYDNFPSMSSEVVESIAAQRREMTDNPYLYGLIPGVKELIAYLRHQHAPLGITTGSQRSFIEEVLEYHGMQDDFQVIITGSEVKVSKPDPEGFLMTLKKLRFSSAFVIEDSPSGILAANAAGCTSLGLRTYFSDEVLGEADCVFDNHYGVLEYFNRSR